MAGYALLRDSIVAALSGVSGIGDVHNYERFVRTKEAADEAFKNVVDGVEMVAFADVSLTGINYALSSSASATTWRYEALTTFRLRFFRSWNDADASGRSFALMLEAAIQAVVTVMASQSPRLARIDATITANEARMCAFPGIGEVTSHYGEITVSCPDQVIV